MDILIIIVLLLIAAETSYLTWGSRKAQKVSSGSILIDTSVLIDGRILAIARSGLLSAELIVPNSVVRELQYMADKADHDKRERARFGLEMIEKLQQLETVSLRVVEDGATDSHGVDEQLIVLAKRWDARLCTIDYNLNKSARVQSVVVININELAHALRVAYLPGESVELKLVQAGQESRQAVGYLDDGTMVVVDGAKNLIGQSVQAEVTRVLQTAAGKMMFAKLLTDRKVTRSQKRPADSSSKERAQTHGNAPSTERLPANDETTNKDSRPVSAPSKNRTSRPQSRNQRRRTSPEDTLVDLANR
jgi:uncharacterized protein YacL